MYKNIKGHSVKGVCKRNLIAQPTAIPAEGRAGLLRRPQYREPRGTNGYNSTGDLYFI